jgi:hypothetical protein
MTTRKPKTRLYTVGIDKAYFAVPPKLAPGVTVADEVRVRATGRTDAAHKAWAKHRLRWLPSLRRGMKVSLYVNDPTAGVGGKLTRLSPICISEDCDED